MTGTFDGLTGTTEVKNGIRPSPATETCALSPEELGTLLGELAAESDGSGVIVEDEPPSTTCVSTGDALAGAERLGVDGESLPSTSADVMLGAGSSLGICDSNTVSGKVGVTETLCESDAVTLGDAMILCGSLSELDGTAVEAD